MTLDEAIEHLQSLKRHYGGDLHVVDINDDPVDFEYNDDEGPAIVVT